MKYFYLSALFAAMQILLLFVTIYLFNRNRTFLAVIFVIIKFIAYFLGIGSLFSLEASPTIHGVVGFLAGLPISAVLFAFILHRLRRKNG